VNTVNNKIKVATIIWKDTYGGAERSLSDLAFALDRSKIEMHFFILSGDEGYFTNQIKKLGFNVVCLHWKNGFSFLGRYKLVKELRRFNPDIIHDHIIPHLTRPFLRLFLMCPIINTEHGVTIRRLQGEGEWWRKFLERFDFLSCDLVIANSKTSADALFKLHDLNRSKVKVIYLGINTNYFCPKKNLREKGKILNIGYIGRIINNHKGVDYLPYVAKHFLEISKRTFKFSIAGDGPDREQMEKICKYIGVRKYFHFLSWISDVRSFLSGLDVLLIPSRYESLGLTALEGLAMNVPVIAFSVGGLREILINCPSAYLVPLGDLDGMAEAILDVVKKSQTDRNESRNFVLNRFSNKRMSSELEEVYMELSKRKVNYRSNKIFQGNKHS